MFEISFDEKIFCDEKTSFKNMFRILVYIYNGKIKNISIDKLLVGLLNSNSKRYYLGTGGKHGCTEEKHYTAKAGT